MSASHEKLVAEHQRRQQHHARVSAALMCLIMSLALGFVLSVALFEIKVYSEPPLTYSLRNAAWDAQKSITASEANLRSLAASIEIQEPLMEVAIANNLAASTRAIEAFNERIEALARTAAAKEDDISGAFLNSKRALFALAAVFIAIVLKLLIELYKYNAHLRAHYTSVSDALDAQDPDFDPAYLQKAISAFSAPHLRIGTTEESVGSLVKSIRGSDQSGGKS